MKTRVALLALAAVAAALAGLVVAGAGAPGAAVKQPDKLVILSTTDVKGRTNPCG